MLEMVAQVRSGGLNGGRTAIGSRRQSWVCGTSWRPKKGGMRIIGYIGSDKHDERKWA